MKPGSYELRKELMFLCLLVASLCMTLFLVAVTALKRRKTAGLNSSIMRKSDLKDVESDCIIHPLLFLLRKINKLQYAVV